jgi:hypothetical protein
VVAHVADQHLFARNLCKSGHDHFSFLLPSCRLDAHMIEDTKQPDMAEASAQPLNSRTGDNFTATKKTF